MKIHSPVWTTLAIVAVLVVAVIGASVLWPSGSESPRPNDQLSVAASFYILEHVANQVGGEDIVVESFVPAGVEAHEFEPTPKNIQTLESADVFLYHGAGLDPWAVEIAPNLRLSGVRVAEVTESMELLKGKADGQDDEESATNSNKPAQDPHIWVDPQRLIQVVETVRDVFSEEDPENANAYQERAAAYVRQLQTLDAEITQGLSRCESDTIVVAHGAFQYFADRYGLEMIAISGLSPEDEPSTQELAGITELIRAANVRVLFVEPLLTTQYVETVATEVGAEVRALNPIEGLTPEEKASGQDYVSLQRENLVNLEAALECR